MIKLLVALVLFSPLVAALSATETPKGDSVTVVHNYRGQQPDIFYSKTILVPHYTGETALMCFKFFDKRATLACFYRNDKSGVVMVHHIPTGESL